MTSSAELSFATQIQESHEEEPMRPGMLVILVGPTAAGKTAVGEELVRTGRFSKLVTTTTREKREKMKLMVSIITLLDKICFSA